ncbi:transcriptional regulator, HxlR family [Seinonella peptonophila]|uniref:Transcriptional regulator, HxlR family n=2 Tax=Seinonella peptonophila TaxID=112248 RepID=A0A1M4WB55_9BACL|nr:transcriptional regulator, HxlR family [Seinonella peptonophila]
MYQLTFSKGLFHMHTPTNTDLLKQPICEVVQIFQIKWANEIINELYKGTKRFKQLQRSLAVVRTQSLTNALRGLEQFGLIHRKVIPTVPTTVEYSLTEKGKDFQQVLAEMNQWVLKWRDMKK